jgi:hypothetical protein
MGTLQAELAFKRSISKHLTELSKLVGRHVAIKDLLSIEETDDLRKRASEVSRAPSLKTTLDFTDKSSERFKAFLQRLASSNAAPVYIWTTLSNTCGLLRPVPLVSIDYGFDFDLNEDGIVAFVTEDLKDRMLLDYTERSDGIRELELEAAGEDWGQAQY